MIKNILKNTLDCIRKKLSKERTDLPKYKILVLKYMGRKKLSQVQKVLNLFRKKFSSKPEVKSPNFTLSYSIEEEDYKYLYRNLVKINKALSGKAIITLNKSERQGTENYQVIISLGGHHE